MSKLLTIVLFCCAALLTGCRPDLATIKQNCALINEPPVITPDYAGITIPPNIAPLNFSLRDSCTSCVAEIASINGAAIVSWSNNKTVAFDAAPWKRLLAENAGNPLHITIYAQGRGGVWRQYATIEDTIAAEPVDRYCTYRLLGFQYNYSSELRECQRDLTSFDETVLLNSQHYAWGCVNCHTPMNNDPHRFVLQSRSNAYGSETLIANGDSITTLTSQLGYAAWHASGNYIAFSVYKVRQYFHAVGRQFIDVFDNNSHIVIYDVAARKIIPAAQELDRQGVLETWPAWSPDGRYLYFCSSPVLWSGDGKEPPDNFNQTQYSLIRIEFDASRNTWGAADTMLSSKKTGLSIAQPRLSPDNRFCLFCMQNRGAYPHAQVSSNLYLMDIETRQYRKLPINSEYNESWHTWSKNSRWILFSSKRGSGIFTRLYFSYIDSAGNAHKAFILPQRDPAFYDSFTDCYNVQEFADAPVSFSQRQLLRAVRTHQTTTVPVSPNTSKSAADWSTVGPTVNGAHQ